ncbi:hypothetical protein [Thermocatellispora tengchongensis]|uniref:hypothetical protein n=1 Tax=Thermocatellispora tengchongensis TaxID=1073253 RepID=UPI0031E67EF5
MTIWESGNEHRPVTLAATAMPACPRTAGGARTRAAVSRSQMWAASWVCTGCHHMASWRETFWYCTTRSASAASAAGPPVPGSRSRGGDVDRAGLGE